MPDLTDTFPPGRLKFGAPSSVRTAIRRPRLDRLLSELFDSHSVVEIAAAAGSGKTTQAGLYAVSSGRRVAWLTLDRADRSGQELVSDLARALAGIAGGTTTAARDVLSRSGVLPEAAASAVADDVAGVETLVVIDDAHETAGSATAAAALAAFLHHLPDRMRVLLLTREHLPLQQRTGNRGIARLDTSALNLSRDETAQFVARLGRADQDPEQIRRSTAGWVTGVCLVARSGLGSQYDARVVSEYLCRQVLDQLPDAERRFLVDTSVADDAVSMELAVALYGRSAPELWTAVLARQLPATTTTETTISYQPLFRTLLRQQLADSEPGRLHQVRERYARYLASVGRFEDATEVWLALGRHEEAIEPARSALPGLLDRSDWSAVLRWVGSFDEHLVQSDVALLGAYLRAMFGLGQVGRTRDLVRRLEREGRLGAAIKRDPSLLAVAAWAMQVYPREALDLLDKHVGDSRAEVIRYTTEVVIGDRPVDPPDRPDAGFERHLSWGLYLQGRLDELAKLRSPGDESPVVNPNLLLAPAVRLEFDEAARLWALMPPEIHEHPHTGFVGGLLDLTSGDVGRAREQFRKAAAKGRRWRYSLSHVYEIYLAYAELLDDGPAAAIDKLEPQLDQMRRTGQRAYVETVQCILGMAYLCASRDSDARQMLRDVTASMTRSRRQLMLPLTAALLSEAQARGGEDAAAQESAALAYQVSQATGNLSALVRAVRMFPGIRQRETERNPQAGHWARLIVTPSSRSAEPMPRRRDHEAITAVLQPFGRDCDLFIDGRAVGIGRTKLVELMAGLALHPHGIDRDELRQRLFPDTDQHNGGNRFRQLTHKLRTRTGLGLERREHKVVLPEGVSLVANDIESEWILSTASSTTGSERANRLEAALGLVTGVYLERSSQPWVEERRDYLSLIYEEARLELATLRLELGDPDSARDVCETVLATNRYSDSAYRLLARIEQRAGTPQSVSRVRRRAAEALGEVGLFPGDARLLFRTGRSVPSRVPDRH